MLLWGLSGRFLVTVSGIEILYCILAYPGKATIKTEARQQAALKLQGHTITKRGYTGTRYNSGDLVYLVYIQAGVP